MPLTDKQKRLLKLKMLLDTPASVEPEEKMPFGLDADATKPVGDFFKSMAVGMARPESKDEANRAFGIDDPDNFANTTGRMITRGGKFVGQAALMGAGLASGATGVAGAGALFLRLLGPSILSKLTVDEISDLSENTIEAITGKKVGNDKELAKTVGSIASGTFQAGTQTGLTKLGEKLIEMGAGNAIKGFGKAIKGNLDKSISDLKVNTKGFFSQVFNEIDDLAAKSRANVKKLYDEADKAFAKPASSAGFDPITGIRSNVGGDDVFVGDALERVLQTGDEQLINSIKGFSGSQDLSKVTHVNGRAASLIVRKLDDYVFANAGTPEASLIQTDDVATNVARRLPKLYKKAADAMFKDRNTFGRFEAEKTKALARLTKQSGKPDSGATADFIESFFTNPNIPKESQLKLQELIKNPKAKEKLGEAILGKKIADSTGKGSFDIDVDKPTLRKITDMADDFLEEGQIVGKNLKEDLIKNNPFLGKKDSPSLDLLRKGADFSEAPISTSKPTFNGFSANKFVQGQASEDAKSIANIVGNNALNRLAPGAERLASKEALARQALSFGSKQVGLPGGDLLDPGTISRFSIEAPIRAGQGLTAGAKPLSQVVANPSSIGGFGAFLTKILGAL